MDEDEINRNGTRITFLSLLSLWLGAMERLVMVLHVIFLITGWWRNGNVLFPIGISYNWVCFNGMGNGNVTR